MDNLDPVLSEFLKSLEGSPPVESLPIAEARNTHRKLQSVETLLPAVELTKHVIEGIDCYVVRPVNVDIVPGFMFFHGGGWTLGDFHTHERFIRELVVASGCAAIAVNFTLSPEAKYGQAINECYKVTKWVAANGKQLGVDGSRLALVGNSAGGALAVDIALLAVQHGPKISHQILMCPVASTDFNTASYSKYANNYFLTRGMMEWFWDNYCPTEKRNNKLFNLVKADLTGLPPTLIQLAELDVLHDEGIQLAKSFKKANVKTFVTVYRGMIHDFEILNPLSTLPSVKKLVTQASKSLAHYLKE